MRIIFLTLLLCWGSKSSFCQTPQYDSIIIIAKKAFIAKNYLLAGTQYHNAFKSFGGKGVVDDRYNAAISWSMAGVADSAFLNLFRLAEKTSYLEYYKLITETRFKNLQSDKRWNTLLKLVNPRNEIYKDSLAKVLSTIYENDQKYRHLLDGERRPYSEEPTDSFKAILKLMSFYDSLDLLLVTAIIDKYGWLSKNEVGTTGNSALWLVIQHADLSVQEKYLPIMRTAVENGKASKADLAYLEDRILMRKGQKQLYGSQYKLNSSTHQMELWEIEDPPNLNKRRASVGLPPMEY